MDEIKLASSKELSEMRKLLNGLKQDKTVYLEFQVVHAEIIRAKYLALIEQGFTEEQALELCDK